MLNAELELVLLNTSYPPPLQDIFKDCQQNMSETIVLNNLEQFLDMKLMLWKEFSYSELIPRL